MSEFVVIAYAICGIKHQNCVQFGCNLKMMAKLVDILRGVTLKCTATPTESGSTKQYQKKKCCMHIRLLKLGFRVKASWRLNKIVKVSALIFLAGIPGTRLLGQ